MQDLWLFVEIVNAAISLHVPSKITRKPRRSVYANRLRAMQLPRVVKKLSRHSDTLKRQGLLSTGAKHLGRSDVHVDIDNVPAIVRTGTAPSLDCFKDWPCSFPVRRTPMIVSDLPNQRDTDEIRSATVVVDADRSCRLDQSTTTTRSYRVPSHREYRSSREARQESDLADR